MRIKDKFYKLKGKYQRFKRGYSDCDIGELNSGFIDIMPKMLKQLRDNHFGYPMGMTDNKGSKILDDMIYYFNEAGDDTCSLQNEFDCLMDDYENPIVKNEKGEFVFNYDNDPNFEKGYNREREIDSYKADMKHKALKLFVKYFDNLWD